MLYTYAVTHEPLWEWRSAFFVPWAKARTHSLLPATSCRGPLSPPGSSNLALEEFRCEDLWRPQVTLDNYGWKSPRGRPAGPSPLELAGLGNVASCLSCPRGSGESSSCHVALKLLLTELRELAVSKRPVEDLVLPHPALWPELSPHHPGLAFLI